MKESDARMIALVLVSFSHFLFFFVVVVVDSQGNNTVDLTLGVRCRVIYYYVLKPGSASGLGFTVLIAFSVVLSSI